MEENKKEEIKETVPEKEYYTKAEINDIINKRLNENLAELLNRFSSVQPKQEKKEEEPKDYKF